MPKVTLTYENEDAIPQNLKAFKTADNKVEVWVGDKVAEETNAPLAKNRDDILAEKEVLDGKYKSLLATTSADDKTTAAKIFELEQKAKNPIAETDQKILDAVKKANPNATPEEIEKAIKEHPTLTEKITTIEKTTVSEKLFNASGFKNRTVFDTVYGNAALNPNLQEVVWKDEKDAQGNPVSVPYAKLKTAVEGKVEVPFGEYTKADSNWQSFLPSLTNGTQQQQSFLPANQHQHQQQSFSTAGSGGSGLPSNKYLDAAIKGQAALNAPKEEVKK